MIEWLNNKKYCSIIKIKDPQIIKDSYIYRLPKGTKPSSQLLPWSALWNENFYMIFSLIKDYQLGFCC